MEDVLEPGERGLGVFQVQCEGCGKRVSSKDSGLIAKAVSEYTIFRRPSGDFPTGMGTINEDGDEIPHIERHTKPKFVWYCESCWTAKDIDSVLWALRENYILDY